MKRLFRYALTALVALAVLGQNAGATDDYEFLRNRVVGVWEMSVNVEDMRNVDLKGFTFYAPECPYCKKRKTGFNP